MTDPKDSYWYDNGRNGGSQPGNSDSQRAWESYNDGRAQRDIDRTTNDALDKLINGNNKPY